MRTAVISILTLLVFATVANAQEIICVSKKRSPQVPRVCKETNQSPFQDVQCVQAVPESIATSLCWYNAYNDLQDALDEAAALADQGSLVEIWVAAGIYHPDRGTGDREMSFSLHKNVEIYGGFAGWETFRDQRDFVNNETILSGDLNNDDNPDGDFLGGSSSCCTEHDSPGCDDPVCEALVCIEPPPREPECCTRKWDHECVQRAVLSCCDICSTRNDCENALNVLTAFDADTTAIIDGLTITSGHADAFSSAVGGGIRIEDGGATLRNCIFRNNAAASSTAVRANNSDVIIKNCLFTENDSFPFNGTAAVFSRSSFSASGSITVEDSIFYNNSTSSCLAMLSKSGTVLRTTFIDNNSDGATVGFRTSATFDQCRFIRNSGSGGIKNNSGSVTVKNSEFIGNDGEAFDNSGFAVLYNCLFIGNRAEGAVFDNGFGGSAYLEHCTFVNNENRGVDVDFGIVELKHCVFWNNRNSTGVSSLAAQVATFFDGIARVSYSALQNYDGPDGTFPGPGNTGDDPMFVDIDGPDDIPGNEDDNLRLRYDSPLINAGDPDATLTIDRDLDGHTRILCGRVDMGPYELGIGDFDCNGQVDVSDLADLPSCMTNPGDTTTTAPCSAFDFNADKAVDLSDYAAMQTIISPQ